MARYELDQRQRLLVDQHGSAAELSPATVMQSANARSLDGRQRHRAGPRDELGPHGALSNRAHRKLPNGVQIALPSTGLPGVAVANRISMEFDYRYQVARSIYFGQQTSPVPLSGAYTVTTSLSDPTTAAACL